MRCAGIEPIQAGAQIGEIGRGERGIVAQGDPWVGTGVPQADAEDGIIGAAQGLTCLFGGVETGAVCVASEISESVTCSTDVTR